MQPDEGDDGVVRVGAGTLAELTSTVVPMLARVGGITRTLTCPIAGGAHL